MSFPQTSFRTFIKPTSPSAGIKVPIFSYKNHNRMFIKCVTPSNFCYASPTPIITQTHRFSTHIQKNRQQQQFLVNNPIRKQEQFCDSQRWNSPMDSPDRENVSKQHIRMECKHRESDPNKLTSLLIPLSNNNKIQNNERKSPPIHLPPSFPLTAPSLNTDVFFFTTAWPQPTLLLTNICAHRKAGRLAP